jgi:hypothetical protein
LRVVKDLGAAVVLDSRAVGRPYLSPVRFQTFEENAGKTNSTTARLEANGQFAVQRPEGMCSIGTGDAITGGSAT